MSSDESVRPGHVEALGAAYRSLESEGEVTGAAAFGTKRGRIPSAKIAIAQLYGWEFFWRLRRGDVPGGRAWARAVEDH